MPEEEITKERVLHLITEAQMALVEWMKTAPQRSIDGGPSTQAGSAAMSLASAKEVLASIHY